MLFEQGLIEDIKNVLDKAVNPTLLEVTALAISNLAKNRILF